MTTGLFVAALLAALPVFLVATALRWQAAAGEELDVIVDTRFLSWDSPLEGVAEGARPAEVSTMAPSWPTRAAPLMATANATAW